MNIHTPFELLELSKKGVILQLKEKNIEYKINDNFIKFEEVIEELNLKCQVEIYYGLKKINSISLSYDFDNSFDNNSIFKQLEQVKNIYKEQFDVENYFDPKDGKSFFYTLCYKEYGIYLHGPSYCSNESEKYFGITYNKDIKCAKTVKNKSKDKKFEIKKKHLKKIDKYADNDFHHKWYGLITSIESSKRKLKPCRVDAKEDQLVIYYLDLCKIEKFAIEFNKIRRYDLFEDFVSIRYEKELFFFTIVKNDVSVFDKFINEKIGYNSNKFEILSKIISEAFIEYNVFDNSSSKETRYKYYIKNLTKSLFRIDDLNKETIYNTLQGIDFDMYFYYEWKNFANYLYNKLKEHNYF